MSERFVRNHAANPMIPLPKQVPAKRALARLPGRKIFYADTGGEGEAVVFLHPAATGDPKVWAYQQPVFAKAGYRVICYARRGYYKSDNLRKGDKRSAADDLNGLFDALAIEKAHIVSTAAGGSIAADFALSYPKRTLSLAITSNYAGIRKGNISKSAQSIRPKQWNEMPRWYREFSCSYIAANPRGLRAWDKLADHATKRQGRHQANNFLITAQNPGPGSKSQRCWLPAMRILQRRLRSCGWWRSASAGASSLPSPNAAIRFIGSIQSS
jgi:pimeloyl-ACP methyl ester carboxylesterase